MTKLMLKIKEDSKQTKRKAEPTHTGNYTDTHTLKRKPETQGQTPRAVKEHFLQFQDTIVSFV